MNKKLVLRDLGAGNCINLLQPMRCTCGCGGYGQIVFEIHQDVVNFAGTVLEDEDCNHAYIFALTDNGVSGAFTSEEGVRAFTMTAPDGSDLKIDFDKQVALVKDMVAELEPHCVGILQHTNNGRYRIVMETIYDR